MWTDVLPFSGHLYTTFVFQTHLEMSIVRHKAHIKKCELLLRLLDNDELSLEKVNDVRDFLEDYVERNQVCFLNLNFYYYYEPHGLFKMLNSCYMLFS